MRPWILRLHEVRRHVQVQLLPWDGTTVPSWYLQQEEEEGVGETEKLVEEGDLVCSQRRHPGYGDVGASAEKEESDYVEWGQWELHWKYSAKPRVPGERESWPTGYHRPDPNCGDGGDFLDLAIEETRVHCPRRLGRQELNQHSVLDDDEADHDHGGDEKSRGPQYRLGFDDAEARVLESWVLLNRSHQSWTD